MIFKYKKVINKTKKIENFAVYKVVKTDVFLRILLPIALPHLTLLSFSP